MLPSKMQFLCIGIAVLALCAIATPSQATLISVPNASFEDAPVSNNNGVTVSSNPQYGWEVADLAYTNAYYFDPANNDSYVRVVDVTGEQILEMNKMGGGVSLTPAQHSVITAGKDIGTNLAANTTYTLSVDLLNRMDTYYDFSTPPYTQWNQYFLALHAGDFTLGTVSGIRGFVPTDGNFVVSLEVTTGASPDGLGSPLWIELGRVTGDVTENGLAEDRPMAPRYDNVQLDGSAVVPEPSTLVLLGCGLISLLAYAWRKRR